MRVSIIGAGLMGVGMAQRLLAAGHSVAFEPSRNAQRNSALLADGGSQIDDRSALVSSCDVLLTCVPDAPAIEQIAKDVGEALRAGQLWIDASTSQPDLSKRLAETLAASGAAFADAPVTGGPPQAAAGALASLVGCHESDFARVSEIVGCYSKVVRRFGGPGTGHTAKLLNNFVTQGATVLLAEAYDRARRAGVDWNALYETMQAGAARSGTLEKMVGPALDGNYKGAQFALRNARKDIDYYRQLAAAMDGADSRVAEAVFGILDAAVDAGHGDRFVSELLDPKVKPGQAPG